MTAGGAYCGGTARMYSYLIFQSPMIFTFWL
jgi:hypothetical protein